MGKLMDDYKDVTDPDVWTGLDDDPPGVLPDVLIDKLEIKL